MTHVFQHSALALSMLSLAACGPSGESGGTTPKQAAEAEPVSYNVPTVEEATPKVAPADLPEESESKPKPEEPDDSPIETAYVEESGETRRIPQEFKQYPEWGLFVYSDQLLGHYKNQIEKSEGNADEIQAKMRETAGTKDGAFDAMSRRYNDEGNEGK